MVNRICNYCNKRFQTHASEVRRGGGKYCSPKCAYEARKGSLSPLWVEKIKTNCLFCGKEIITRQSRINQGRGRFCSRICRNKKTRIGFKMNEETKRKLSEMRKGKLNPAYKHGKSYGFTHYQSLFPKSLSKKIRERDKFICQKCDKTPKKLDVHHMDLNQLNNNPLNLTTLCVSCHRTVHQL